MEEKQISKIEIKLYSLLFLTGGIANIIGFIANAILFGITLGTFICGVCAMFIIILGILGDRDNKRNVSEMIMLFLLNFLEFPFLYYVYGKGTLPYMILGIVGTAVFMNGRRRQAMLVAEILFDVAVMVFAFINPSTMENITEENSIGSTVCSFLIVSISVGAMLTLLLKQYMKQQKEIYEMAMKLESMAKLDHLTGLFNRRYLTEYIEEKLRSQPQTFSIVLIDIDNFKSVNDNYGHVYGDLVLQSLAEILISKMSGIGIAARYGGEEFMLVFDQSDRTNISNVLEQTANELIYFSRKSKKIDITFSGGVEEVKNTDQITIMFNAADERLYQAKKEGKNRIVF